MNDVLKNIVHHTYQELSSFNNQKQAEEGNTLFAGGGLVDSFNNCKAVRVTEEMLINII